MSILRVEQTLQEKTASWLLSACRNIKAFKDGLDKEREDDRCV